MSGIKEIAGCEFVIVDVVNRGGDSTYDGGLNSRLRDKLLLLIATFSTTSLSSLLEERESM
jgi:hypothetical protein